MEEDDSYDQDDDQAIEGMADKLDDMNHSEFVGNNLFLHCWIHSTETPGKLTCQDSNRRLFGSLEDTDPE